MKLSQKGQITIPKAIRDEMDLQPGEEVEFEATREGFVLKRKQQRIFRSGEITPDDPLEETTDESLEITRGSLD